MTHGGSTPCVHPCLVNSPQTTTPWVKLSGHPGPHSGLMRPVPKEPPEPVVPRSFLYLQGMQMISDPQRAPISGARRVARLAMAAGLVAALSAAGPIPMAFSADAGAPTADPGTKSAAAKLGSNDADLLAEAKANGDKNVTMMI